MSNRANYEHLSSNVCTTIRREMRQRITEDPKGSVPERLDRAARYYARKYGVRKQTIFQIWNQGYLSRLVKTSRPSRLFSLLDIPSKKFFPERYLGKRRFGTS